MLSKVANIISNMFDGLTVVFMISTGYMYADLIVFEDDPSRVIVLFGFCLVMTILLLSRMFLLAIKSLR